MTDWNSPDELHRDSTIFNKLIYVLFGIYAWEILNTMHVERALILRMRTFQWPQILYFLCRYTLFLGLAGLLIALSVTTPINCQALFGFIQWAGNTTIGTSSSLLLVRTIAVWNRSRFVIVPMLLLAAAQWGLLYYSITSVKAEWSPESGECAVTGASTAVLKALYMYTMGFDLVILVMTISGLWIMVPGGRGGLWKMLFADGVVYFTLVASANSVPAVLNVLDLNSAMNIIATVPACVVSTIAATRLFRRLQDYTSKDVYVHTSFMAGIPSAVGSNRRWSATQGKATFSLSGTQIMGGASKLATESVGEANWGPVAGLMPHFASFAPREWERRGDGDGDGRIARHPYASAGGEQSFLSVNEKGKKDTTAADLPTFVSFTSPRAREREDGSKTAALLRYGSPRLSKLDVQVEVIEMKESVSSATGSPSSARAPSSDTAPQEHRRRSADDVV